MGEYAMIEALRTYGFGNPSLTIYENEKVECPICGKLCGGKSGFGGERGKYEGVHQHMKQAHGVKQKWKREYLLGLPPKLT